MNMKIIKNQTPDPEFISKGAVTKSTKPLFYYSKTRIAKELNLAESCKITTEKILTNSQSIAYNRILDEQRKKDMPRKRKKKKE